MIVNIWFRLMYHKRYHVKHNCRGGISFVIINANVV